MDSGGSQGVLTSWSTEHHVGNGGDSIHPFPLGDLLSRRNGAIHVVLPLHCDGVLLILMVGSNVVHLGDGAAERGPGAADVEGGFVEVCFFHTSMIAQNRRDFNRCCATSLTVTRLLYQNVRKDRMPFLYLSGCNLQRSKEHKNHLFLMP